MRGRVAVLLLAGVVGAAGLAGCGRAAADHPATAAWAPPSVPSASVPATAPPSPSLSPSPAAMSYAFPVKGNVSYVHIHHDYPATDLLAACGTQVVAAATGTVLEVTRTDTYRASVNAGATRGGLSVSILGDDGVRYYGSHFSAIEAAVAPGVRVTAGQPIGKIGRTGDASACHLHFGISPPCRRTGDWWIQRGVIWPWPYLDSWKAGGAKSAVAEISAWQSGHGCPDHPLVDP